MAVIVLAQGCATALATQMHNRKVDTALALKAQPLADVRVGVQVGVEAYSVKGVLGLFKEEPGWGITAAGIIVIARVFARLARTFPQADGPYAYMRSALGEWPAFLALWCYWISLWITNSALAVGLVGYLGKAAPQLASVPPLALALALVWIFVVLNLLGARTGGRVQVVTTALSLCPWRS